MKQPRVGAGRSGGTWSLRREWSRAFTVMLALLLLASIGTFVGVGRVVGRFGETAGQFDRELTTVASLQTSLIAHEATAHQLLTGTPVDRVAFVREQDEISTAFEQAAQTFPAGANATLVTKANTAWQAALTNVGLWGDAVRTFQGPHEERRPVLGAASDKARDVLAGLQAPSLAAMRQGVADSEGLNRVLMAGLGGLFGLAVVVTVYFRRRMTRDLVRPVASLHRGVVKLRSGDYSHRIDVARRDELGELAEAFNDMAGALHDTHRTLTERATHDALTGVANRALLTEYLTASFGSGSDRRARRESVLFIDVDDFKNVNDSLGHERGDILLTQLAARLTECVRPQDMVGRLGGDEFAIVVMDDEGGTVAADVAERVLAAVRAPFVLGDLRADVSVSIGVAPRRLETSDAAELLRQADFAMYMAKGGGKGRYEVFDVQMHDNMRNRSALKSDLALAVSAEQLRIDYQPVANLRTGAIVGVEALVRWEHPTLGRLAPAEFITLAEETGDIDAIGCWVLETATRQVAGWRQTIHQCANLWVGVNLSPYQLRNPRSLASIRRALAGAAAQHVDVVLEITETALAADLDGGIASLTTLKGLGVRLAIDDFGTGFSSLSTLASLPVDIVKIDRSFVSSQTSSSPSAPMLHGILGLAKNLSLEVIAEGIEEPGQLELLRILGCQMGQGYLLCRPVPADILEALLVSGGLRVPVRVAA